MSGMTFTAEICKALESGDAGSYELSVELNKKLKDVSGTISNLVKQKNVAVVGRIPRDRGWANLYRLVAAPTIGRPRRKGAS